MARRLQRRRLYLFPALLPLVEVLQLLALPLGAVAGIAGFSFRDFWKRHKLLSSALIAVLLSGAAWVIDMSIPDADLKDAGSRLILREDLPKTVSYQMEKVPVVERGDADKFDEARSQRVSKQILAAPVMSGGRLVTATYKGTVEAYDPQSGKPAWSIELKEPIIALTEKDGVVYVGEGLHHTQVASLTAVRGGDGHILWRREILGHVEEPAAVLPEQGLVLTGSGPGGLWALDIDDGRAVWHAKIGHMDSRPLFHDGIVYAQAKLEDEADGGHFYALDADDGAVLWHVPLPGQPWGEPVLMKDGETILTTSGNGQIGVARDTDGGWAHAISIADKKVLWTKELGGMPLQPGLYVKERDIILHALKSGDVVALDTQNGNVVWRNTVGKEIQSSGSLVKEGHEALLAVISFDGMFKVLRARDGAELARRELPKGSTSSPLVKGDNVYIATPYQITVYEGLKALAETK